MLVIKYCCLLSSVINEGQSVLVSLNYWFDKTIIWPSVVVFDPVVRQEKTNSVIHQSGEFWKIDWRTQARIMQDLLLCSKYKLGIRTVSLLWLTGWLEWGRSVFPSVKKSPRIPPAPAPSSGEQCQNVVLCVLLWRRPGWIWPVDMFCLINLVRYFPWLINIDRYYIITQTTNTPLPTALHNMLLLSS